MCSSYASIAIRADSKFKTGNFGDVLAGYFAKRMGLPISKLVVATNENVGTASRPNLMNATTTADLDILHCCADLGWNRTSFIDFGRRAPMRNRLFMARLPKEVSQKTESRHIHQGSKRP